MPINRESEFNRDQLHPTLFEEKWAPFSKGVDLDYLEVIVEEVPEKTPEEMLYDALQNIATGTSPSTTLEAWSFVETAKQIAELACNIYDTNKQIQPPHE